MQTKFAAITLSLFLSSTTLFSQLKAGDIAPNAKYIDADELYPFIDGVAVISKGNAWALIDSSGNFVVPFNKWVFTNKRKDHLLIVLSIPKGLYCAINTTGKVIIPEDPKMNSNGLENSMNIDDDGYAYGSYAKVGINYKGEKIPAPKSPLTHYHENLAFSPITGKNGYQLVDRQNKTINPGPFDYAGFFSEGHAVVGKRNEFGEMKYGFIDRKGVLVIPYKYSIQPKDFKSGLALVEAKASDDFRYAYINKKGDIVFKIKNSAENQYTPYQGSHEKYYYAEWTGGNSNSKTFYIDTLGNILNHDQFCELYGLPLENQFYIENGSKSKIFYSSTRGIGTGVLDLKTKKILPPIYYFGVAYCQYDQESNRMRAGTPYTATKKIIGYINDDGVYVIVKADAPKW